MKKLAMLSALLFLVAGGRQIVSAQNESTQAPARKPIKVACVETSKIPLDVAQKELQGKLNIELVLFDKNVDAIRAIQDGSADAGLAVHKKFMEKFNAENKGKLVMVQPYAYYTGIGLYSEKYKSASDLPDGARIAIPNDAMNMDKGLRMMRDAGIIGLKEGVAGAYSILDITQNPKKLEFIDMDQIQTVRALQDVDASIIFFSHMKNAGKDFNTYLLRDNDAEDYPIAVVVREENLNQGWAKTLAEALRSDAVKARVNEHFGGVYTFYK